MPFRHSLPHMIHSDSNVLNIPDPFIHDNLQSNLPRDLSFYHLKKASFDHMTCRLMVLHQPETKTVLSGPDNLFNRKPCGKHTLVGVVGCIISQLTPTHCLYLTAMPYMERLATKSCLKLQACPPIWPIPGNT